MYVCMSITLLLQIASSFFLFLEESSQFLHVSSPAIWDSTKLFCSMFDLGPLTPKIYSPKFKIAQNHLYLGLYAR